MLLPFTRLVSSLALSEAKVWIKPQIQQRCIRDPPSEPEAEREKRKKQARLAQQRKRKALADLPKALASMGESAVAVWALPTTRPLSSKAVLSVLYFRYVGEVPV